MRCLQCMQCVPLIRCAVPQNRCKDAKGGCQRPYKCIDYEKNGRCMALVPCQSEFLEGWVGIPVNLHLSNASEGRLPYFLRPAKRDDRNFSRLTLPRIAADTALEQAVTFVWAGLPLGSLPVSGKYGFRWVLMAVVAAASIILFCRSRGRWLPLSSAHAIKERQQSNFLPLHRTLIQSQIVHMWPLKF